MAYESPLFQSALELLGHSIEHFNWGTEKDRKFTILHLANAVELILKDLILDLGESIYKNPKETITISGTIKILTETKKVVIPNLNKLELLIDERNSLQHRYGFPNELTTIFYMENTYSFFETFLKENYKLDLNEVITEFVGLEDLETYSLRKEINVTELNKLVNLSKIHPVGALLSAYAYVEKRFSEIKKYLIEQNSLRAPKGQVGKLLIGYRNPELLPSLMVKYDIKNAEIIKVKFQKFTQLRNLTAHGRKQPNSREVNEQIEFLKELDPLISELDDLLREKPEVLFGK